MAPQPSAATSSFRGSRGVEDVGGVLIDYSQPMLKQVGNLGDKYDEWTHRPLAGAPRYFESDWAETFTKNPWWVVPLIWVPLDAALVVYSLYLLSSQPAQWATYFATGCFLWQLIEYSVHRFMFHMEAKSYAFIVFHFSLHGAHHKFPLDKDRLVFPPLPASIMAATIYAVLYVTTGQLSASVALMSGVVAAYVSYDMMHYWCHHGRNLPALIEAQKRVHMNHHYKDHDVSFGISSPLIDYLFFTFPGKAAAEKME